MSKTKKIIICFLGACLVACSALTTLAVPSNEVYYLPVSQPQITPNSCYLEVVCENERLFIYCTAFGLTRAASVSPVFKASVKDGNLIIYVQPSLMSLEDPNLSYPVCVTGFVSYIDYQEFPQNRLGTHTDSSVQSNGYYAGVTLDYSGNVLKVHGYNCDTTDLSRNGDFTYVYGSDTVNNNKIDSITSGIQSNDDKNTQAIIDNQNQLAEQEKTETQNSADNSVSDISGSVPDQSAGMLSALQSLSNAVSYTGTSAKWNFPQMYIPAISGVTDRINLNSEMEIDFTYWVNQIPQDIKTVISALATIGLVIFAFKELYGLISYVLTLKGGGNNE